MLPAAFELWQRQLLTDPQTSGGLLIACAPDEAASILSEIQSASAGYGSARIIGEMTAGSGATVA